MKKKIWAMLLLCVFMLSMVGCGSNTTALNDVQVEMQNENRTLDEANQITAELSYPIFSDHSSDGKADNMLAELNAQIQNNIDAFLQQTADAQPGDIFACQNEVVYNNNGLVSIVEHQNLAGEYRQYAATYSLQNGKKATLGELLDKKESQAEELVFQHLGGVIQSDPNTFHSDAADYVQNNLDKLQYYRSSEGLAVFFQAGEIAPESVGVIEIVIQ